MTEKLKQIVKEEIAKLPKENQEAINALDWGKISEDIGGKYALDENELNDFQVETLLVLVGLTDPAYYAKNIENKVGTTTETSENIANEVMEKIFTPIKEITLKKIRGSDKVKNSDFEQSLNFILSGGDYSSFVEKREIPKQAEERELTKEDIQNNLERTLGIKDKFVI